jgi:lysophospholipase L1-like esterase
MAYYPCNNEDDFGLSEEDKKIRFATRTPESLIQANGMLQALAEKYQCRYINVNDGLYDERGLLRADMCVDGVHMNPAGYQAVLKNLLPYFAE